MTSLHSFISTINKDPNAWAVAYSRARDDYDEESLRYISGYHSLGHHTPQVWIPERIIPAKRFSGIDIPERIIAGHYTGGNYIPGPWVPGRIVALPPLVSSIAIFYELPNGYVLPFEIFFLQNGKFTLTARVTYKYTLKHSTTTHPVYEFNQAVTREARR